MSRHVRRGPSALRLELLELRTLLSSTLAVAEAPAVALAPAAVHAQGLVPNNPDFKLQWGLSNPWNIDIDAPQAWTRTTGSSATIIAVLDTGIDLSNPQFAGRIWTNPDPPGDPIDAAYPGDVNGWNFVANDPDVQDDNGHGTHVAGILAATGNDGIGVAGVDWNAQIMPLKVLDANGNGSDAEMVSAIDFAVQHGAKVINASWGGGPYSQALADAISYAGSQGVVFVTAAGNNGSNDDTTPFYPASYDLPNEIAVAAVDEDGQLASFSNYGVGTVALAAPGVNIFSTVPGGYEYMSGTSMATAYVSGVVALVAALHPSDTAEELVQQVESTARPLPGLAGKVSTGGIVDAARAVGQGHPGTTNALRVHTPAARSAVTPADTAPAATPAGAPASAHRRHPHHHRTLPGQVPGLTAWRLKPQGHHEP